MSKTRTHVSFDGSYISLKQGRIELELIMHPITLEKAPPYLVGRLVKEPGVNWKFVPAHEYVSEFVAKVVAKELKYLNRLVSNQKQEG